jgi:hypothetical protein
VVSTDVSVALLKRDHLTDMVDLHGYLHVRLRYRKSSFKPDCSRYTTDITQGLGGGLIALPSFAKRFGLDKLEGNALANAKGNIVSILQGGW